MDMISKFRFDLENIRTSFAAEGIFLNTADEERIKRILRGESTAEEEKRRILKERGYIS